LCPWCIFVCAILVYLAISVAEQGFCELRF
jgi:hypothetical protein